LAYYHIEEKNENNPEENVKLLTKKILLLLEVLDFIVNTLVGFEFLLAHHQKVDALNEHVDQVDFAEAQSISVRDIKKSALGSAIDATSPSLLESELLQDIAEALVLADLWDFNVHTASHTGAQVAWASEHVAQVFVPHELVAGLFDGVLELVQTVAPSGEGLLHVAILLHGNNSDVVLLVDPNEKVLGGVVPDASATWPVSRHAGADQEWADWLIKKKVVLDELILLLLGHITKWVVLASELTAKTGKRINNNLLDLHSLGSAAPWW